MFQHIAARKFSPLMALGLRFHKKHNDSISALLCFDHRFSMPFNFQDTPASELSPILTAFLIYAKGLSRVAFHWNPCQDEHFQRLFGFSEFSADRFLVHDDTLLKNVVLDASVLISVEENGVGIRAWDLQHILTQWIRNHMVKRVQNENLLCRHARAYSPCVAFTVLGECVRGGECYHAHLPGASLDSDWFHHRVRIVLQQILVYQTISAMEGHFMQLKEQRCGLLSQPLIRMLMCLAPGTG